MTAADTAAWESLLAETTTVLRQLGIDADIDLYHLSDPDVDWTRFGSTGIANRDFTLVAMSQAWKERWEGTNRPTEGAGAANEADALRGLFTHDQASFQHKVKILLLPGQSRSVIPADLIRVNYFQIDPAEPDSVLPLVRTLTGQPAYVAAPLGAVPVLSPQFEGGLGRQAGIEKRRGDEESDRMLAQLRRVRRQLKDPGLGAAERTRLQQIEATLQGVVDALLADGV